MRKFVQIALRGYKSWVSPMLPAACRYLPTCSEYAEEAVERYGIIRGGVMAMLRLLRCHPFGGSGFDPVVKHSKCHVEREWLAVVATKPAASCRAERRSL